MKDNFAVVHCMAETRRIQTLKPFYRESINPVASLGFIGLSTDRASFKDFTDFVAPFDGVMTHATRIPMAEVATPESLAELGGRLKAGTEMLVPGQPLQSISFSCTSGTIAVGVSKVKERIQAVRPETAVATPIDAAVEALRKLNCKRISLLMPYLVSTSELVADFFEAEGFILDRIATFDLGGDPDMNKVDEECMYQAGVETCHPESDALFISCTGWRTYPVTQRLEDKLGKPVVSSNQALAWAALRRAGDTRQVSGQGVVFSEL